ncbi:DUF1360 domain-containing protein [Allostreptomyces psammosilenae]|uniref:DUF1360 domain-containing protein n=1 Tax=Allostreptomyces psammosilenae TaxID=1892865 RepID=A0A852ZQA8_9ACTN|nr:DUF1360 domain-containing protein [Allostreptomyces psammosilenae]NYI03677.1 hypothetical protein [Allostreptomyces psammosilenae]
MSSAVHALPRRATGAVRRLADVTGRATGSRDYSPREPVPLRGYAALAGAYAGAVAAFALGMRAAGRPLPERVPLPDLLLLGIASHKASRLIAKDRVTSFLRAPFVRREGEISASEVMDVPRGEGVRRTVGELVACPFCVSLWVSGALVGGFVAAPRVTRLVASTLACVTVSDWAQYAWSLTQQKAE